MLSEHEAKSIKEQIVDQINASFPEEKKRFAIERIESMSLKELEDFMVKNNLAVTATQQTSQTGSSAPSQCIFCLIISGNIDSHKIAENDSAIAVLEINPASKGHILIIPREHTINHEKKAEKDIKNLIKKISSLLKKKLKAKKVLMSKSNLFGHETINLIPQFGEEVPSQRSKASPEELLEVKSLLEEKKKPKIEKAKMKPVPIKPEEKMWLPRRIP